MGRANVFNAFIRLILFIGIGQFAGYLGSRWMTSGLPLWYLSLEKPPFMPPDKVFAPVWVALYFLLGFATVFVTKRGFRSRRGRTALFLFALQLVFQVCWSWCFFGLKSTVFALIDIIVLWAAMIWMVRRYYSLSKLAGILLIPYVAWISFAVVLNFSIMVLNW